MFDYSNLEDMIKEAEQVDTFLFTKSFLLVESSKALFEL